jgi:LmbE family N-acetylglucosaminyl deacetylase
METLRATVAIMLMTSLWGTAGAAPRQPSGAELGRAIDRLGVVGRVLYVAAHPDDENTRLLAWLANQQGVRAAYLSLTRGEGGQNLIGSEQAPLLGVIRTGELLAARGVDGAEQWFGMERDFGFSKSPEETLRIWDHDAALADVVWVIRRFRPDVIVTRFSPEQRETHGHHTASAMLALEAFRAAADDKAFPEQLKEVTTWQARRIVWNKGVWPGAPKEDLSGFLTMDVGGFDAVLGASYGELAARSRSMHKSQGFGVSPSRGPAPEYFKLLAGEPMRSSILDGVELGWRRHKGADKLIAAWTRARDTFHAARPWESVPALLEMLAAVDALPTADADKRAELVDVILGCTGFHAEAVADDFVAVPGVARQITVSAVNRSKVALTWREAIVGGERITVDKTLPANQPVEVAHALTLAAGTALSNPYWLRHAPAAGRWNAEGLATLGRPSQPTEAAQVSFTVEIAGRSLSVVRDIDFAWNDPVAGERRRPLEILPPVTLDPGEPLMVFAEPRKKSIAVTVTATAGAAAGELRPNDPGEGWSVSPAARPFKLAKKGDSVSLSFDVMPPAAAGDRSATLSFATDVGGLRVHTGVRRIEYTHLPIMTLSPAAEVKLVRLQLKRGAGRVGYIPGAGDEVPAALRQAGYDVTVLSEDALRGQLDKFSAIVTGIRAFNVNPRLAALHDRLMAWVAGGGTLLVQYNTQNRLSKLAGELGPYPFNISQERVTDESAAVTLADHPLLHAPNAIGARDFEGWVQERGLYFADKWDPKYTPLATLADPGEPPRKGALLVAAHGKGRFIYTGLAFFRQLPAGVPGAYRLFANLLSHGR